MDIYIHIYLYISIYIYVYVKYMIYTSTPIIWPEMKAFWQSDYKYSCCDLKIWKETYYNKKRQTAESYKRDQNKRKETYTQNKPFAPRKRPSHIPPGTLAVAQHTATQTATHTATNIPFGLRRRPSHTLPDTPAAVPAHCPGAPHAATRWTGQKYSKVSCTVFLYVKSSSKLTFENFWAHCPGAPRAAAR